VALAPPIVGGPRLRRAGVCRTRRRTASRCRRRQPPRTVAEGGEDWGRASANWRPRSSFRVGATIWRPLSFPCRLLAHSGPAAHAAERPLLRGKQTWHLRRRMSAFDPMQTLPS
jgi:hypothetical protein